MTSTSLILAKSKINNSLLGTGLQFVRRMTGFLALLLGLFASIPLIRVFDISLYVILMVLTSVLLIGTGQLRLRLTLFHAVFVSAFITFALTQAQLPEAYQRNNLNGLIGLMLIVLVANSLFEDAASRSRFMKGFMIAGKIQVIWIFLQIAFYAVANVDLNSLVFNEILGITERTSQYKANGLVATGLCWNAGGIAAVLFTVYVFEKSLGWRVAIFIAGLLTQSSTIILGLLVCMLANILKSFKMRDLGTKIPRAFFACFSMAMFTTCIAVVCVPAVQETLLHAISVTAERITMLIGATDFDSSFTAHFSYYSNVPELLANMSPVQILFGYGIDCSGLPYTALTSQYYWLDSWFVESDPVNTFLGMGIVGFVVLYGWLFSLTKKAWGGNRNSALLLLVFIMCGLFYDLQSVLYYYLMLVEICLSRTLPEEL